MKTNEEMFKLLGEWLKSDFTPKAAPLQSPFLDNADLKAILKISDKTLYRMRKNKLIPFFEIGKKIYYPLSYFNNLQAPEPEKKGDH